LFRTFNKVRLSSGSPTVNVPYGCSSPGIPTLTNPYGGSPKLRAILLYTLATATSTKLYGGSQNRTLPPRHLFLNMLPRQALPTMQFTYEYRHSVVGGAAVPRFLFNIVFFLKHFNFGCGKSITVPKEEAICRFCGQSSSGTPGSKA